MSKSAGTPLISKRQALEDPKVFGKILEGSSWAPWRAETPEDLVATVGAAATLAFGADQQVAVILSQRLLGAKLW